MKLEYNKIDYFDQDGHLSDEAIALYVDGMKLDQLEKLPIEIHKHLSNCEQCNLSILELYNFTQNIDIETGEHPFFSGISKPDKNLYFWLKVAAVFIVVVTIGISVYFFSRNHISQNNSLAFAEFAEFEQLIETKYRNEAVEIISPKNSENFDGKVLFKWNLPSASKVYLQIYDNKGNIVKGFEHITVKGQQYILTKELPPGLYYWKLITEGDMLSGGDVLFVGKFYYKKE